MYLVFITESFVQEKLLNTFYIPGTEQYRVNGRMQQELPRTWESGGEIETTTPSMSRVCPMSVPIVVFLTVAVNIPVPGEGKIGAAASNARFISECISH